MFNELAAERLVRGFQRQQAVAFRTAGSGSSIKDAACHVGAGESPGVLLGQFPPKGHEPRCVIAMIVRDHQVGHV